MVRLRAVLVLAACVALAALAGRQPGLAHLDSLSGEPRVWHAADLSHESSNMYFVVLGASWHHNPWRCQLTTDRCEWPDDPDLKAFLGVNGQQRPGWPYWDKRQGLRWVRDSYVYEVSEREFDPDYVAVTSCLAFDSGTNDLDCGHDPPSSDWLYVGTSNGDAWTKSIHRNDRSVIAAVCLTPEQLDTAKANASFRDIDMLRGWHTDRSWVRETLGRGWTGQGDTPRIALYDETLMGGTAQWFWEESPHDDTGPPGPWLVWPSAFESRDSSESVIWTDPMSPDRLGSCWSDPVVVDDSVPWMAATVCQRASDFNLRVGNTDTYPWVDATGKPWYRALDHTSTPEATRLYRPLDWALLGFEEWEPLADAAVAAGLVWAVWPDDPDDPAYDSTGRSYADYGGKPVCILANG